MLTTALLNPMTEGRGGEGNQVQRGTASLGSWVGSFETRTAATAVLAALPIVDMGMGLSFLQGVLGLHCMHSFSVLILAAKRYVGTSPAACCCCGMASLVASCAFFLFARYIPFAAMAWHDGWPGGFYITAGTLLPPLFCNAHSVMRSHH